MSIKTPLRPFLLTAAATVLLDLGSKLVVHRTMTLGGPPIPVLGQLLRLVYIQNEGAAFSLFQGSRWFFIGISALSILIILSLALSGRYRERSVLYAFGLILGGACGNLIDRIWLGRVIDFIEMGIGRYRWPVYNVADIGVTVGVALLAGSLLWSGRRMHEESVNDPGEPRRTSENPVP